MSLLRHQVRQMPSRRKSPFHGLTWLWSRSCWPCCTPDPLMQFVSHTSSPPTVLAPSQMQYFLLLNFMRFLSVCLSSLSRFLQMVAQPLKKCWMFGVHKLTKSALCPITQVVTKVMRKQYWSLRDPSTYWAWAGLCTTDHISKLSSSCRSESFCVWEVLLPRTEAAVVPQGVQKTCWANLLSNLMLHSQAIYSEAGRDKFLACINKDTLVRRS